jgi:hypothetical protein
VLLALWARHLKTRRHWLVAATLGIVALLYAGGLSAAGWMLHAWADSERYVLRDVQSSDPASYPPDTRLYFLNLPVFAGQIGPALHMTTNRPDLQVYALTLAPDVFAAQQPLDILQEDQHTLLVTSHGKPWFAGPFGELVQLGWFGASRSTLKTGPVKVPPVAGPLPFRVEIVQTGQGGISSLRFTFDRPLDDPQQRIFVGSRAHAAWPLRLRCPGEVEGGLPQIVYSSARPQPAARSGLPALPGYVRLQATQRFFDRAVSFFDRWR